MAREYVERVIRKTLVDPVLTPQLYVNNTRLCDADTDLGLDYMLSRLIERAAGKAN